MMNMKGRKFYTIILIAMVTMAYQSECAFADTVTDFENWTPDSNGGYVNSSTGQEGSNSSSDVHVSDEGSGREESSSTTTESGGIVNTETDKQSSVTITTDVTNNNSSNITDITNGEMIETGKLENSTEQNGDNNSLNNNNGDTTNDKDNNGDLENPKDNSFIKPENIDNTNRTNNENILNSSSGTNKVESGDKNYGEHYIIASAEAMESVTVNEKGEWVLTYRFKDGSVSTYEIDTAEEFAFILTGVKNEKGEIQKQEFFFSRSDELTEWIFKYYLWRAVNISFNTSSYYGTGKIVAKTTKSSTVFTLNEAGKYRVLATPYHDVRHYHIYEWEDEDGSHTEEITDYWEYDRTKSPDVYSVVVPIITEDGVPIKVCVNGGCDCDVDLNAVCDEENEPIYEINEHAKLEK